MLYNKRIVVEISKADELIMTIDENMLSCEFGALDRGNITDVTDWGIYANRGSISFIDNIGYFNQWNVHSSSFKNYIVKFYLAKYQRTLIATFKVDSCTFDDETRKVDIHLISKITELQRRMPPEPAFTFREENCQYLIGLSNDLTESEVATYPWYYPSFGLTEGEENKNLEKTIIYCPYLPKENAWNRISNICQSTMYRVIESENGEPIITGSFPDRTAILVNPNNIIGISKSDFVIVQNSSIDVTNRNKYTNKRVEQISKHFDIQYDETGTPISISNCDYDIANNNASISCRFDIPYKTYSCSMSHVAVTVERTAPRYVTGTDGEAEEIYEKASYVTKEFGGGAYVVGNDKTSLLYKDKITNIVTEYSGGTTDRKKSIDVDFYLTYFVDDGITSETNITDGTKSNEIVKISSNDLIQTGSYYIGDSENIPLSTYILEEVRRRYSKGIECFEIECLFNDYYDLNGNNVFSRDDLSDHFKKYDVIIPYVMKKGQKVPLRKNADGTPKKFRIIGISYSYDGLLRQRLSVQEERYDID